MSLKPKETLPWKMPIFFQFVHTSTLPHFWHNTHKRGWVLLHEFQTPRNRLKHEAVEAHDEARGPSFWQVSKYALYHPTHGKPRPKGRKILFNECAEKLINPENPPSSGNSYLAQDRKVWKRMEVDCWHHWEPPLAPQPSRDSNAENASPRLHNLVLSRVPRHKLCIKVLE